MWNRVKRLINDLQMTFSILIFLIVIPVWGYFSGNRFVSAVFARDSTAVKMAFAFIIIFFLMALSEILLYAYEQRKKISAEKENARKSHR